MKLRLPAVIPHRPSPKQMAFLAYEGREALYGGAAGGGKTDALLMAALQYIDYPGYSAILLRRSYTDLALPGAIMDRAREWLSDKARWDRETHTFHFPSGAKLAFGYIASSADRYRYQSAEFQYIGWDEITEFPMEEDYTFMFSRLRRTETLMDVPLRVRTASNPVGQGLYWVKKRFIDAPTKERIFIPATFTDNPFIDQDSYRLSLKELPEALQKKLIEGDWTAIEDVAFPEFDYATHVVDNFASPQDWRRWEGMDFGVTNPTAWLAAAMSPEGDILIHDEYYEPGLISRHASVILTMRHNHWGEPLMAVSDPSVVSRTGFGTTGMDQTVHSEFSKNGIYLVPANNDRRAGRIRVSELLRRDPSHVYPEWHPKAGQPGAPHLYINKKCRNLVEQIQFAPLDEVEGETVNPYWESRNGHAIAALRYLLTARVFPDRSAPQPSPLVGRQLREMNDWPQWQEVS